MGKRHIGWVLGCALVASCYSGAEFASALEDGGADAGDGGDGDGDGDGECGGSAVPTASITRMNRDTYVRALEDVFGPEAVQDVSASLGALPASHGGIFASETLAPSYSEVAAGVEAAFALSTRATQDLGALHPCLADVPGNADLVSNDCLTDYAQVYGRRLFRRPIVQADLERLAGDYAIGAEHSVAEGVATLTTAMLIDAEFLYFTEVGGEEVSPGVLELTPYETAARLARVLWNSVPDDELLDAAQAGLSEEMLAVQVDRMLDDPRAAAAMSSFFYDWLELETAPYPAPPEVATIEDGIELRESMEASALAFGAYTVLETEGTYADLLLDNTAYLDSPVLAGLYGVEVGQGVALPADERAGLLTRVGVLATMPIPNTNAGHVIKRGAKLSHFICRPLSVPNDIEFPEQDPAEPGDDLSKGIRERFVDATSEGPCWGCHVQIDALGGPFGHYDALGEWIETERLDPEDGGEAVELPIDTSAVLTLDGEMVQAQDGIELSQLFATSEEGPQCFAEHITRNMLARPLEGGDACLVEELGALLGGAEGEPSSVRAALTQFVSSPRFRKVKVSQ